MISTQCAAILAAALAVWPAPSRGQDAVSCKQLDEVISELRELRKLVEGRLAVLPGQPQAATATIEVGDAPFLGSKDAPLTVVEFTDYQCPFCQRFFKETFPLLKKFYIDSDKVRFYVMDLPLVSMHKNSLMAAQAARCAKEQNQFWAMLERMQANPDSLEISNLVTYAGGIDIDAFRQCVETGKFKDAIEKGIGAAQAKGARGTPTFVVGKSTAAGVEGEILVGAVPFSAFERKLRDLAK